MFQAKKILIAITGGIGSGKTTFAKFLTEQGYIVISADEISKKLLSRDPNIKNEIIKEFGSQSFSEKKVNKKFLADKIFSNPVKLQKINSILHPRVREEIKSLSDEYFKTRNVVFVEAALIFESKIAKMYDLIVLIQTDKKLRMKRVLKESKISEKDFIKRDYNQLDDDIKMKKADIVFQNNGSLAELKQKSILLSSIIEST